MEYTVQKLAKLAGVSARTIRYYDEIDLLKPVRVNSSGYRIYGEAQVNQLQQILFYREMDVALEQISLIICSETYDMRKALEGHHKKLLDKKTQLEQLIANVEKTLAYTEGRINMTDEEKFEGFKTKLIQDNEIDYGREIREKYGDQAIDASYKKMKKMTEAEYNAVERLTLQVNEAIKAAFETGNPSGELAVKACKLHEEWIKKYWSEYSKEAHMALVQMYVDDERFTAYYDRIAKGCAVFLRDAMTSYTK